MKLDIRNFRSIRDQSVELAPITVLYGPNGSGKSSLLYSLMLLQNIIRCFDNKTYTLFDLGFVNLGDFRAVVHNHKVQNRILFRVTAPSDCYPVSWDVEIECELVEFGLRIAGINGEQDIFSRRQWIDSSFALKEPAKSNAAFEDSNLEVHWNGIYADVRPPSYDNASRLSAILNSPVELVRNIGVSQMQAGFTKPRFSEAGDSPSLGDEDQMGTVLANQSYLASTISGYLEEITGREFRVNFFPREKVYSLEVTDRSIENHRHRVATEIVNDGFGINRIAWMLACTLFDKTTLMCIEEPETHLHPSSVRKLAKVFVEIMREEGKRFLLTTHSEALVLALLTEVSRKNLEPNEVAFYLTTKEGKESKFERQEVNELGQIEGGLTSFMEGELEDLAAFFGRTV